MNYEIFENALSVSAVGNNPKNGRWRAAKGGRKRPVAALVPPPREDSELQTLLRPLSTHRNAAGEKRRLEYRTDAPGNELTVPEGFGEGLSSGRNVEGELINPFSGRRNVLLTLCDGAAINIHVPVHMASRL